jgi:hypothetical protein
LITSLSKSAKRKTMAASRSDDVAAKMSDTQAAEDICNERWYHAGHDLRLAASESVKAPTNQDFLVNGIHGTIGCEDAEQQFIERLAANVSCQPAVNRANVKPSNWTMMCTVGACVLVACDTATQVYRTDHGSVLTNSYPLEQDKALFAVEHP